MPPPCPPALRLPALVRACVPCRPLAPSTLAYLTPPYHRNTPHQTPPPATQIISDFVEGALADVRSQFVEALRRRGVQGQQGQEGAGGPQAADAFYDEQVAPVSE